MPNSSSPAARRRRWRRRRSAACDIAVWGTWIVITAAVLLAGCILLTLVWTATP